MSCTIVATENDLVEALAGADGQVTVTGASMHADLDAWRARAARQGVEVLADSDATPRLIEMISADALVAEAVDELRAVGLAVRMLPASYAAMPCERERMSVWLDHDPDEGGVLNVGLTAQSRPAAVACELARTLSMVGEQDVISHELSSDIFDAARQAFALGWLAARGETGELNRCREALGRHVANLRLRQAANEHTLRLCALRLWAITVAADSMVTVGQIARIEPRLADLAGVLLEAVDHAPARAEDVSAVAAALAHVA